MNKRTLYFDGRELTVDQLRAMDPGAIIAEGWGNYPIFNQRDIHWVAVRGKGFYDWVLYYHFAHMSTDFVMSNGDKSFTDWIIKDLVPCTDEAFNLYQF